MNTRLASDRPPLLAGTAVVGLLVAFLAACSVPTSTPTGAGGFDGEGCPQVRADARPAGIAVIALDRTASGANSDLREERVAEAMEAVEWAITNEAALVVMYFDGSASSLDVDPCLAGRVMVPAGRNDTTQSRNRRGLLDATRETIMQGFERPARAGGSDPLAAIRAAVEATNGWSAVDAPRLVLVSSDFVASAGCLDLRDIAPMDPAASRLLVDYCLDAGSIPQADGVELVLTGVGRVTRPEMAPSEAVDWLVDLYRSVCEYTGATSCLVTSRLIGGFD